MISKSQFQKIFDGYGMAQHYKANRKLHDPHKTLLPALWAKVVKNWVGSGHLPSKALNWKNPYDRYWRT